jgi:malonyl-CoA O-methyltransferase
MSGLLSLIKGKLTGRGLLSFARRRRVAIIRKLNAREGYRMWAPNYAAETATSFLDDELAHEMIGSLPHTQLLDAGCGVGRRIQNIPDAIGMDLSPEMLAAGGARNVVPGDVRAMPFAPDRFDMIWCRLVLGHLPDALPAYRELARVCMPGGYVFVTDFHPDAVAAGHRRTFNVRKETVYEIEHYVHTDHVRLAAQAGLALVASREGVVGPSIREFYLRGIGLKAYEKDVGLKLVSAYLFRRSNASIRANHLEGRIMDA